ncbi:MAG: AAA family ATPase [Lentisphaeria bacterium]|nr:AAA family ATPase [Lentisphaeria bacterium]
MIVRRLHIDNFGCFHDFDLELAPGLNRIAGPNEFGKTTLLEFLRRLFWGFPDKRRKLDPYPALKGSGHYGGFLEVTLRSGQALRLERRGERGRLKLICPDGRIEVCDDIGELSAVSENFYRNVCAVTVDEVTAFAALDDEEVRNRLYGNALSMGSLSLSRLRKELADEVGNIYRSRGSGNLLKKLAGEFAESEKRLSIAAGALPAYEKALLQAEELTKSAEKMKADLCRLEGRIAALEKRAQALESLRAVEEEERRFSRETPPPELPAPLPPFGEKPPQPPPEPEFPERLVPPPVPYSAGLDGRCDCRRASPVTEELCRSVAEWEPRITALEAACFRPRFPIPGFVCLAAGAGALAAAGLLFPAGSVWGILSAFAGIGLLAAGIVIFARRARERAEHGKLLDEARRFREDLNFRFCLNPLIGNGELLPLLDALKFWQERWKLYESEVQKCASRDREIEGLRREYELRRKVYDERFAAFSARREEYDKRRHSFEELCRTRSQALEDWKVRKKTLALKRSAIDALLAETGRDPVDGEELAALRRKREELRSGVEESFRRSGAARREAELLMQGTDCAVEVNVREQLRGRMRSAAERALVFAAAGAVLQKAVERCERERQPELLNEASRILAGFTCGAYTRVYKQLTTGSLRISGPGEGSDRGIDELSRGTREQLFLALRLALILSLDTGAEPLPVVLDDVLVDFDPERKRAARRELAGFAAERQVIIFECDPGE